MSRPNVGPSICFSNRQIRKMLTLAGANENDVMYDLGCGEAQFCIIAVTEFNVKKAVGIESRKIRVKKARERIRRLGLRNRISVRHEYIDDSDYGDASIVYCGLMEDDDTLEKYEKTLKEGARLVVPSHPLVSLLPDKEDYPFYLMKFPFKKTKSAARWASSVLLKDATYDEMIAELKGDLDWGINIRMFRRLAQKRFEFSRTV